MQPKQDVRPSPIAGQWYPADPKRLSERVGSYIRAASLPALEGEIIAIMVPHAGHIYSGPVAGYAFAAAQGLSPEVVAVISPMHYPYPQALLTSDHGAYETPLGIIEIDKALLKELDSTLHQELNFGLSYVKNDPEHSLEIELPFLQRIYGSGFRLLPIMVREQEVFVSRALGKALAKVLMGKKALLVASTDLSHFYTQEVANVLDAELLRRVEAFDPEAVMLAEEEEKGYACGRGALAAVMYAAKELGADRVKVLNHATSGDVTGDFKRVVGYGAAVISRPKK